MKNTTVRGTPVNHVGPAGALVGNREGFTPGTAYGAKTVAPQYAEGGIDNRKDPRSGTPYQDSGGNVDEYSRTVSQHRYGVSLGAGGIDHNNPAANGSGVVLDGAQAGNGYMPKSPGSYPDSPVPQEAPWFEGRSVQAENKAHLGQGNESAAETDVRKLGGVLGRD